MPDQGSVLGDWLMYRVIAADVSSCWYVELALELTELLSLPPAESWVSSVVDDVSWRFSEGI